MTTMAWFSRILPLKADAADRPQSDWSTYRKRSVWVTSLRKGARATLSSTGLKTRSCVCLSDDVYCRINRSTSKIAFNPLNVRSASASIHYSV